MNLPSQRPETVAALVGHPARRHPERPALRFREGDHWVSKTWLETVALVVAAAQWFESHGRPASVTVASAPSPGAVVLELGALVAGCSVNPVYEDANPDEHRRVLEVVRPGLVALGDGCELVGTLAQAAACSTGGTEPRIVSVERLFRQWNRQAAALLEHATGGFEAQLLLDALELASETGEKRRPPALLLQSSGTTGPARVIELDAAAFLEGSWASRAVVGHPHPRFLAFLPAGHTSHHLVNVFTNTLLAGELCFGGPTVDTLVDDLRATRPTVLFGAPMLFGEIRHQVRTDLTKGSALGGRLWNHLDTQTTTMLASNAIPARPGTTRGRLFGRVVARKLGLDQVRDFFSGTSTLPADLHAFAASLGWYVRNTYGVSEMAGAALISGRGGMVPGELGQTVEGVHVRRDASAQIVVSTLAAGHGYLGGPVIAEDGWLATGDLAAPTVGGSLAPMGRLSSQLTRDGHATSLDAVERAAGALLPGYQAVAHDRPDGTLCLFLAPRPDWVGATFGAPTDHDRQLLGLVDRVAVLDDPLGPADGSVGPTGKIRRWRVAANFQHRLYDARRVAAPVDLDRHPARASVA